MSGLGASSKDVGNMGAQVESRAKGLAAFQELDIDKSDIDA